MSPWPAYGGGHPRFCGHFLGPQDDGSDGDGGEVVSGGFLVSRGDPSELLELGEAAFDRMSPGTEMLVEGMLARPGRVV